MKVLIGINFHFSLWFIFYLFIYFIYFFDLLFIFISFSPFSFLFFFCSFILFFKNIFFSYIVKSYNRSNKFVYEDNVCFKFHFLDDINFVYNVFHWYCCCMESFQFNIKVLVIEKKCVSSCLNNRTIKCKFFVLCI